MTIYELSIEKKVISQGMAEDRRLDSIYAYLDTYMGEPGLKQLCECVEGSSEYYSTIGEFTKSMFCDYELKPNRCYALVFMAFEDITEILYLGDNNSLVWDRSWKTDAEVVSKASTQAVIDDLAALKSKLYKDIIDGIGTDTADYDTPIKLSYKDVSVDLFICPEIFEGVENLIDDTIEVLKEDYM